MKEWGLRRIARAVSVIQGLPGRLRVCGTRAEGQEERVLLS